MTRTLVVAVAALVLLLAGCQAQRPAEMTAPDHAADAALSLTTKAGR